MKFIMLLVMAAGMPVLAKDTDCQQAANSIKSILQTEPTQMPLSNIISAFSWLATRGGAEILDVVVFENMPNTGIINPDEIERSVLKRLGPDWQPFIKSRSNTRKERTLILVKPVRDKFKMLILALEETEISIVGMKLDVERLSELANESK
ncbi:MAG: hypothetical protein LUQ69_09375 [Methanoregulaceae archaeon]|nr:hypothetical protein [Methanoregulaceae archaeon]